MTTTLVPARLRHRVRLLPALILVLAAAFAARAEALWRAATAQPAPGGGTAQGGVPAARPGGPAPPSRPAAVARPAPAALVQA
ncbi:hypothetical protein, partial [Caldovatus aquaticus]|nr:hypothetical protein [Caldovatus aquaticus]